MITFYCSWCINPSNNSQENCFLEYSTKSWAFQTVEISIKEMVGFYRDHLQQYYFFLSCVICKIHILLLFLATFVSCHSTPFESENASNYYDLFWPQTCFPLNVVEIWQGMHNRQHLFLIDRVVVLMWMQIYTLKGNVVCILD